MYMYIMYTSIIYTNVHVLIVLLQNSDTWNLQSILLSPMNPNTSNDYCPRPGECEIQ